MPVPVPTRLVFYDGEYLLADGFHGGSGLAAGGRISLLNSPGTVDAVFVLGWS